MLRSSGRQVAIQTTGRLALPHIDQHKVDISAEQRSAIDRRAGPLPAQLIGARNALGEMNDRSWDFAVIPGGAAVCRFDPNAVIHR